MDGLLQQPSEGPEMTKFFGGGGKIRLQPLLQHRCIAVTIKNALQQHLFLSSWSPSFSLLAKISVVAHCADCSHKQILCHELGSRGCPTNCFENKGKQEL